MKRGFVLGVYDACHIGHLRFLQRAKDIVDELIVAVVADEAVRKQKGEGRPMFPLEHRIAIIKDLRWTDHAVVSASFDPYEAFSDAEKEFGPIDLFIKGEDQCHVDSSLIERTGAEVIVLPRTPDVSSTEIIKRLKS